MRVQIESIPPRIADEGDVPFLGQFNRKGRGRGARDQNAGSQSHGLLQHLGTDASRSDEDAALRPDVLHETHPRDLIERVVTADVFGGEFEDFGLDGVVDDFFVGHGDSTQIGNLRYIHYRPLGSYALVVFFMGWGDIHPV